MGDDRQRAYEDIACIRDILARTAVDFKGLASFFVTMGLIWGVYALLNTGLNVWSTLSAVRYTAGADVNIDGRMLAVSSLSQWLEILFLAALLAVYFLCRRKGPDGLSRKLLLIWGLSLFLYIGGNLAVRVIPALQVQMLWQGLLDERMADQKTILYSSMYVDRCLKLVFPVLPILITAMFLDNRRLKAVGVVAAVLVLLWMFVPGTAVSLEASIPAELLGEMIWKRGLGTLIQIIPAAALLAFGLNLKKT